MGLGTSPSRTMRRFRAPGRGTGPRDEVVLMLFALFFRERETERDATVARVA